MTPLRQRLLRTAIGLVALVLIVGCAEPSPGARIGNGRDGGLAWEAWAGRSGSGGLAPRGSASSAAKRSRSATSAMTATSSWRTDLETGELLVVTTAEPGATTGMLRLADGTERLVDLVRAPDVTTMAVFVAPLGKGIQATEFVIQSADGSALELVPLD